MARLAGSLYAVALLTAIFHEFIAPAAMGTAAVVVAVGCYIAVALLLYGILRRIQPSVALVATVTGVIGLVLDALHWHPGGINAGMTLHGVFCILVGWLFFHSALVPRVLAILMAFAGLVWLLYLIPSLVHSLAPFNSVAGLLGEAIPMLWLLFMGIGSPQGNKLSPSIEVVS
jgi:hypothetical protein